jgi:protein-S-isoprenylcysteine O-methyltransferase Ste14
MLFSRPIILIFLLVSTVPVTAMALIYGRWEYHKRDKLSIFGLVLLCAMLFVPNLVLHYSTTYEMPKTFLDFVGVLIGSMGAALCLVSITAFRSVQKVLCINTGKMTIVGPYRWSRNPQYVGWFLFLFGFALNDWSLWGLAALVTVVISLHLLVLVEEEHLLHTFGEQYIEFCRQVPRYVGLRQLSAYFENS